MEWRSSLILLALVCTDPRISECRVACLFEGYAGGYFKKDSCVCFDAYLYKDFLEKRVKRGNKTESLPSFLE